MNWKEQITNSICDYNELEKKWGLHKTLNKRVVQSFPLQITPHYLSLINNADQDDPLKKIVMPQDEELLNNGFEDIMGEYEDYKVKGLQHRYPETALLLVNNYCASYCRFCFRKRIFNLININDEAINDIGPAIEYINKNVGITNVLLSGGDPLVSSSKKLDLILTRLGEIKHLQYVRIGTKVPAFIPQRIYEDSELINVLVSFSQKKPLYIVAHFDHANEISKETEIAFRLLQENKIESLGNIVLLKGINDNSASLINLFNKMINLKISPYYIYHSMPVNGTGQFQLSIKDGIDVVKSAGTKMAGINKRFKYILPHYIGKTEVIGYDANYFYFRQHQARKVENIGRLFKVKYDENRVWFYENEIIPI